MNPGNFTNGASLVILLIPILGLIGLTKCWTKVGEFSDEVWWVYPVQFCPFDPTCFRGFASAPASLRLRYDEILSWSYDWLVDWKCVAGRKIWLITIVLAIIYYELYIYKYMISYQINIWGGSWNGGYFMVIPCHGWPTKWRPVFGVFVTCSSRSSWPQTKNTTPSGFPLIPSISGISDLPCFVDVPAWAHFITTTISAGWQGQVHAVATSLRRNEPGMVSQCSQEKGRLPLEKWGLSHGESWIPKTKLMLSWLGLILSNFTIDNKSSQTIDSCFGWEST